jgi:acyl dehydratase
MPKVSADELLGMVGWESEPGEWMTIDQERIDSFADATLDHQFIHVDPERAGSTPLGGTVAHGFLTLALLPHLSRDIAPRPEGLRMAFNYGLNKVRFPRPVKVGSEVRLHWKILAARQRLGRILVTAEATVEVRGEKKPAMVAETLTMFDVR